MWVLNDEGGGWVIVDGGEGEGVLKGIWGNKWEGEGIFVREDEEDEVGGVKEVVEKFREIVVYGGEEREDKGRREVVKDRESGLVLGDEFSVIGRGGESLGDMC